MLDSGKRTCKRCEEDQREWGIPLPNCQDPDGDGTPCPFPDISRSLDPSNVQALDLWSRFPDQIIRTEATMAGCISTLNLESLISLMELAGVEDRFSTYRKVRVIFNEWRRIQDAQDNSKTAKSLERVSKIRKGR